MEMYECMFTYNLLLIRILVASLNHPNIFRPASFINLEKDFKQLWSKHHDFYCIAKLYHWKYNQQYCGAIEALKGIILNIFIST